MIVKSLKLNNYMSFKDVEIQDLEPSKIYLITGVNLDIGGKNGIGKSALIESIVFSIYGKNIRLGSKDIKELIRYGSNELLSEILLSSQSGDVSAEIKRIRNKKKGQVRFIVNGEDRTQRTDSETNQLIENSLLSFDKFLYTSYFNPFSISFFSLTPKQKLQILEELLNLSVLDELEEKYKLKFSGLQNEKTKLEYEISKLTSEIEQLEAFIPQYELDLENISKSAKDIREKVKEKVESEIKKLVSEFRTNYERLKLEKEEITKALNQLNEELKKLGVVGSVEKYIENLESSVVGISSTIQKYSEIYKEYSELIKFEICPTCKQKIDKDVILKELKQKTGKQSIEELKEEIIELQENLKSTKELLNRVKRILQEISRLQTRLSFVENELSILLSKTDSRIVDFILNYDNKSYHDLFKELYDKELTSHSQIVKSMEEQKRVIIERIDKANQELSKKKKDYERLSKKLEQIDNEIKKLQLALKELSSTGSFRSLVLENYLKELEESINYMLSHLNKDTFLKLYISGSGRNKGIQVSIFENNIEKSYSQLSTGERRFVDMSLLLTFSAFSPMDFVLIDEALDSLSFENQLKVVSLLSALDKQVFLVSHNEKMIDEISNDEKVSQIFITKENGISEVEVR